MSRDESPESWASWKYAYSRALLEVERRKKDGWNRVEGSCTQEQADGWLKRLGAEGFEADKIRIEGGSFFVIFRPKPVSPQQEPVRQSEDLTRTYRESDKKPEALGAKSEEKAAEDEQDPLKIIKLRLARGEITIGEYEELKKTIETK